MFSRYYDVAVEKGVGGIQEDAPRASDAVNYNFRSTRCALVGPFSCSASDRVLALQT